MLEWIGSELVEINDQLKELHNKMKSQFQFPEVPNLNFFKGIVITTSIIIDNLINYNK